MSAPAAKPSTPLGEVIARLSALHPVKIDLSLDRMHRLLERLDHPERRLPPVIHVAGTNGKGSTIAYLRAILEAAGLRVHVFTSPYLVRVNECFRLGRAGGGVLVGDDELRAALERCEAANAGAPLTVFEGKTVAAFCLFAENPADVVLLEVGLGGRLDATNVVARPAACCITPVDLDHREFLGDTIAAIAGEKARLLGYASFADYVLEDRMAKRGADARAFVDELAGRGILGGIAFLIAVGFPVSSRMAAATEERK